MKLVLGEFNPISKPVIDEISQSLIQVRQLKLRTLSQLKRVRRRMAQQAIHRKSLMVADYQRQQQKWAQDWRLEIEKERREMRAELVSHIQQKCQEIIRDILVALVDETPSLAIARGNKRLKELLTQLSDQRGMSISAANETACNSSFAAICHKNSVPINTDASLTPGSFAITLPHGRILTSVEDDLKQLLNNWNDGLALVQELNAFLEQKNG